MPAFDYSVVADIYDQYVSTDFDVPFFLEESERARGCVLELMCGTGRLSLPLLKAGIRLTCVDSSAAMLKVLRSKVEKYDCMAVILEQDVTDLSLAGSYSLALIPFNSLSEIIDPVKQHSVLSSVHRSLESGGRLIVTLHNPSVRVKRIDGRSHVLGQLPLTGQAGSLVFSVCEHYDPVSNIVTGGQVFEAKDANGASIWVRKTDIAFRLILKEQFREMAEACGYDIEALFGNYDRSLYDEAVSPFMIWMLKKSSRG